MRIPFVAGVSFFFTMVLSVMRGAPPEEETTKAKDEEKK